MCPFTFDDFSFEVILVCVANMLFQNLFMRMFPAEIIHKIWVSEVPMTALVINRIDLCLCIIRCLLASICLILSLIDHGRCVHFASSPACNKLVFFLMQLPLWQQFSQGEDRVILWSEKQKSPKSTWEYRISMFFLCLPNTFNDASRAYCLEACYFKHHSVRNSRSSSILISLLWIAVFCDLITDWSSNEIIDMPVTCVWPILTFRIKRSICCLFL